MGRNHYGTNGYSFSFLTVNLLVKIGAILTINLGIYYINAPFQSRAVICIMFDNVNKLEVSIMTTITERDFKSEYLLRTCSVATNLATSLKFRPVRCATMLCHFGQTRNASVATHFILLSSTATSSATGAYVDVPDHLEQNEEPAGINKERTKEKHSFVPKS